MLGKITSLVRYEGYEEVGLTKVRLEQLRPRAKTAVPFLDLDLKQEVLVNHNLEQPEERGFWYDAVVTAWRSTTTRKVLEVTIQGPGGKSSSGADYGHQGGRRQVRTQNAPFLLRL